MSKMYYIFLASLLSLSLFAQNGELSPEDNKAYLRAVALYSEGLYEQAHAILTIQSRKHPDDDAIAYYLGCAANELDRNEQAEEQLTKAYQIDSTNSSYIFSLTSFYDKVNNPIMFATFSEKLLKVDPVYYNSPEVLARIADGQLLVRKDSLALNLYDRLLELVPDYAPAIGSKMFIYRKSGRYVNFFVCLEQLIESPHLKSGYKCEYLTELVDGMTSQFYWVWGDTLLKIIEKNLELYPEEPKAHLLKIRFCLIKGDNDEAIERTQKMIQVAKDKNDNNIISEAYSLIGDLYHQSGNKKAAYDAYKNALKANPDYAAVLNNYAYYLSEDRSQLRKALKMSTRAIELEPDNATYLDTHGWILFLLGKASEAKPHFKHAMIYGGKESAVILEHYSQVLNALGEKDLAKYYLSLSEQKKK